MKLILALLTLLPTLALAQTYGIATRPSFTAFNGGTLPTNLPTFSGSWSAVPAFPNLTFVDIMGVVEMPGQAGNARKLVVWEREGRMYSVPRPAAGNAAAPFTAADLNNTHKTLLLDISNQCQGWDDSGLLSLAYHPNYAANGYVYIYYTYVTPGTVVGSPTTRPANNITHRDRLARFTANTATGVINPASELVLMDLVSGNLFHAGGGMFFHPVTGFLHLAIGDDTNPANTQQITSNFRSSVVRIDVNMTGGSVSHAIPKQPGPAGSVTANYFIPNDNPFVGVSGALEEIFCLGLRSPHSMTFDATSGRAFIGDVGEATREEVSVVEQGESGLNFQWNRIEGLNGDLVAPYLGVNKRPIIDYGRGDGSAVIGGRIYRSAEFASDLGGRYIFGDNVSGNMWYLDETTSPVSKVFLCTVPKGNGVNTGSDYRGISYFGTDADNEFYICQLGTTSAQIYKLQRGGTPAPVMPPTLSSTGLFSDLPNLVPSASFIPYGVNTPLWSDNAQKSRWFAIPTGQTIGYTATGNYTFPQGSVWLKHFSLPVDDNNPAALKRLETRVLVRDDQGGVYGVTYRWRPDGTDADIVNGSQTENVTISGSSEIGMSLTTTDIGTQVFDLNTTALSTGYEVSIRSGDIWNTSDNFRFLHAAKTGDFDARVRIESFSGTQGSYAKAGIMARSSTATDSAYVFALVFPNNAARNNNNGGHELQYRTSAGAASAAVYPQLPNPLVSYPQTWLRLKREGNTFIHYWSEDGTSWKEYGRRTQTMPATLELGLATTSNNTAAGSTARYHLNLQRTQTWFYPGKADCLQCHRQGSGFVLGQNTAQSNRLYDYSATLNGTGSTVSDNQLRAWAHAGYFDTPPAESSIPNLAKMRALSDTSASAELRMRSYLDSNCAHCHQTTGGGVHAFWDGRFELSLAQTGIVNGFVNNSLGLTNSPRVLVPQNIDRSIMHHRMKTASAPHKMPPVAKSLVDQEAMAVLEQWINEAVQPPGDPLPAPWQKGDIGTVTTAGDATFFNGTYILTSNGTGIGGTADSLQAASYQLVTGDAELVAQVSSLSNSSSTATAGVMVRETLAADSRNASTLINYSNQALFSRRKTTGGSTVTSSGGSRTLPHWVKIRRRGPYIESYTSGDGTNWTLIGSDVIGMAQSVYFCLVHSSGAAAITGNATFDGVTVTPGIFGSGTSLTVNNTAANPITWAASGISGASVANGPVLWYQNDSLSFTGTGADIVLNAAQNLNTGLLNLDATSGNFIISGGSLITGGVRAGTGDTVIINTPLAGTGLNFGELGIDAVTGSIIAQGSVYLNTSPTSSGTVSIQSGIVNLNSPAVNLFSSSAVTVTGSGLRAPSGAYPFNSGMMRGGMLQITTGAGDQIGSQMVTLNGGTILFRNNVLGDQTLTIQNITLATGGNSLITAPQTSTVADTLAVTNLTRAVGATLEVRSASGTLGGTGDLGRVTLANLNGSAAANVNGIVGGWAHAGTSPGLTNSFATLTANGFAAATPDRTSSTTAFSTGLSTENWLVNNNATLNGVTLTVNSLIAQNDVILNNGARLVLGSGGLVMRNNNFYLQTQSGASGSLTSAAATGELFIHTPHPFEALADQRIRIRIEDNGTTPLILVKSGPGRVQLDRTSSSSTYTGGTRVNEGALFVTDPAALGTGSVTVRPGGSVWIAGGITLANTMTLSGFGAYDGTAGRYVGALRLENSANVSGAITLSKAARVEVNGTTTLSGLISGVNGSLEKTGSGTLQLGNVGNTFSGDLIVSAGILRSNGFRGTAATEGTLGLNSSTRTISIQAGATMDWMVNNILTGAGSSAAALPRIVINGGTLQSANFNVVGHVTLNGGTLTQSSSNSGAYQGYQLLGDVTATGPSPSFISTSTGKQTHLLGGGTNTFNVDSGSQLIISTGLTDGSGDYYGTGTLAKTGTGTLQLTQNSNYTGSTSFTGTLILGDGGAAGSLGSGPSITNNGELVINRDTSSTLSLPAMTGSGAYTQTNGNVVFSAVNSFAGPNVINGGTLQLSAGGTVGGLRGTVTVNAGATLRSNNTDTFGYVSGQKVNVLNINGGTVEHTTANNLTLSSVAITMNGGTLQATGVGATARLDFFGGGTTLTTDAAATTTSTVNGQVSLRQNNTTFTVNDGSAAIDLALNGPITNSLFGDGNNALIKAGTGTLALNGASTYTGATTINAGTLILTGSLMSPLTTNAAILAPQGTPSTTAALTQTSTATLRFRVGLDQLTTGNSVTLDGVLDLSAAPSLSAGSYLLINKTSPGAISGTFTGLPEGSVFTKDGHTFRISYAGGDGNDLVLTKLTPIEIWRNTHFGSTASTGNAADTFDFDGDGLPNLIEFAFGLNPTQASSMQLPQATLSGGSLSYRFTPPVTGISYSAEWSTTLQPNSWTTIPNTGTAPEMLFTVPAGSNQQLFLRLKVAVP